MKSNFTEEYESFRLALLRARKSQQVTQSAIAKQLGKPQSFVSKYESGERRLDVVEFCMIAKVLGVNAEEILRDARLLV